MNTTVGAFARWWICVVVVLATAWPAVAQDSQPAKPTKQPWAEYQKLSDEDHSASIRMSGDADLANAAFTQRFRPGTPEPDSDHAREAEKVRAMYQAVLDRFPGTEKAAYTALQMAGFYQHIGQWDKALEMRKDVAFMYERTPYGPKAALAIGLTYIQGRDKDADAAIEWLRKIPMPDDLPYDEPFDHRNIESRYPYLSREEQMKRGTAAFKREDMVRQYINAQQSIIRVLLMMQDKPDEAKIIRDDLKELFPYFKDSIDRDWDTQVRMAESAAKEKARREAAAARRATTGPAEGK